MPFKAHTRFNFLSSLKKNSLHALDTILEFLRVNQLTCQNYSVFSKHCLQYIKFYCSKQLKVIRFFTTNLIKTNFNPSVKLKSFTNSKLISIESMDSCNSFLHKNKKKTAEYFNSIGDMVVCVTYLITYLL